MDAAEKTRINAITRHYESLKSIRSRGDALRWKAMAFIGHRTKEQSIDPDCPVPDLHLYDCAGKLAVNTFVESLGGSVMSPGQDWFSMRVVSKDYSNELPPAYGIQYTSYAKNAITDELNHSNFYDEQSLAFFDSISCGYSCTLFQNDPEYGRVYLQTFEPWRCWFDTDRSGHYNTFIYRYFLDGYQLIERYGDSLPKDVFDKASKTGKYNRFEVLFCVVERDRIRDSLGRVVKFSTRIGKKMRYASLHILRDAGDIVIHESGYKDFPIVIHVWQKAGDSPYGIGFVMKYIEEFSKLNRIGFEFGLTVAKMNHGAWLVPDTMIDSFDDNPEARIPYQSSDLIPKPLQENLDVKSLGDQLVMQQQYISKLFYNDIFSYLLNQDKVFTATQVNAVKAEGLARVYPIYTRLQTQKIDPSLRLVFSIMMDNGRLQKPDESLVGRRSGNKLEFILDSSMSQMLQKYQTQTANALLIELIAQFTNLGYGQLIKRYMNVGNLILSNMEQTGAPSNLYVPESERKQMEKEDARMMAQQLQLQSQLTESEINRNNAGAANLNNAIGANGGAQ